MTILFRQHQPRTSREPFERMLEWARSLPDAEQPVVVVELWSLQGTADVRLASMPPEWRVPRFAKRDLTTAIQLHLDDPWPEWRVRSNSATGLLVVERVRFWQANPTALAQLVAVYLRTENHVLLHGAPSR